MTTLQLTNATKESAKVYITLGATPGCVQDVSHLVFSDASIKITALAPLMGFFSLNPGSTFIAAPTNLGFNGNISFDTPPMNCKSPELSNGMNLAEFIINNGFQDGNPQETIDNSCVCGANAVIKFDLSADDWAANYGKIAVTSFQNKSWDNNTGIVGVFPYGCDNCTASTSPPDCIGLQPQFANTDPICNVQRNAKSNKGGNVHITFLGYL